MRGSVAIYGDEGVSLELVEDLQKALVSLALVSSETPITIVDAEGCRRSEFFERVALFIMPGGRDLPYLAKLQGAGAQNIQAFVNKGGRYLGLCAGAYFGAAKIVFDKGLPTEISGERPLEFFKGQAVGPIFGPGTYQYNSRSGAEAVRLDWPKEELPNDLVYYNGGCQFENLEADPAVKVLARYGGLNSTPAAIISAKCGDGKAVLCGVHPEFDIERLDRANSHEQSLYSKLSTRKPYARGILEFLINRVLA